MTTAELLRRMVGNASGARECLDRVGIDAEETPIPGWLAVEITRIGLALGHLEAQLRLELESV